MASSDGLEALVEDGVVEAVHGRLMSGKEASVYVVSYRGEIVAAKVYKARERRTFKATASYTEGRNQTRSTRDKRAMAKRSSYGSKLVEESWREMEYRALFDAFHGGVRVPKPIMLYEDVLLMQLVVDAEGNPAPRVADFDVEPENAEALFREIHEQVRRLLATGRVHGDLSAFNVLMAHDGPTIIDMPQVVDASGNNQAREILRRDLRNVAEHLARYDARLLRFRESGDGMWRHYERGTLEQATEPFVGSVRTADRPQGGRRERLAESGRMNRDRGPRPQHPGGPPRERGPFDRAAQGAPRADRAAHDPGAPRHERPRDPQGAPRHERPQQGPERPQHDRPRGDRPPQQGAPRHDRPQHDRPQHDRPQHDRPRGDRPPQQGAPRPQHDRPHHDRPHHDRPQHDRPQHDRPQHDRPQHDRPQHGRPRDEGSRDHQPRHAQQGAPRHDRAQHERPQQDRPQRDDRPRHDRPPDAAGRPTQDRPRDDRPRDDRPRDDRPRAEHAVQAVSGERQAQGTQARGRHDRQPVQVDVIRRRPR